MIENEFDSSKIKSIELGVSLYSGHKYLVPVDSSVDAAFKDMLARTIGSISVRSEEWSEYSLSQDYGMVERVYSERSEPLFTSLSSLYSVDGLDDMANLIDNVNEVDYYFVVYHDEDDRKIIGVRKAAQLKTTLTARNRLIQFVDNTLKLIENPVFRLDKDFDGLIADTNIYFSNFLAMEYIAKITDKVAKAAEAKIPVLTANIKFLDFSLFEADISKHPRTARLLVAISKRPNIDKYDESEILSQAAAQGVVFVNDGEPCLRCRVADKHKLLEVLDDRRWISRNATDGPVPYRAASRQRT